MGDRNWWVAAFDKVDARHWEDICRRWIDHTQAINPPGNPPESSIGSLPDLETPVWSLDQHTPKIDVELEGAHFAVFREGVFLLHKAAAVLGASQENSLQGKPSWALSGAYHAAFFAAKATTRFLGVADFRITNSKGAHKDCVIDVWPTPGKRKKAKSVAPTPQNLVRLIKLRDQLGHKEAWALLQRLLRIVDIPAGLIPPVVTTVLAELSHTEFALQRNTLHYHNGYWPPLADLFNDNILAGFGRRAGPIWDEANLRDTTANDFSMVLGLTLFQVARTLFADIVNADATLAPELAILGTSLGRPCHALLADFDT